MLVRTFFSFSDLKDIKSLSGFVKGGRDKVPKESSDYAQGQISGWAKSDIKEHIEEVATKSKHILQISARDFRTPIYDSGTGAFDCQFFNYDFSVTQSEEDFGGCIFTGLLEIRNLESFHEIQDLIDSCFGFTFEKVTCILPKSDRDLKELIYTLDDNKNLLSPVFEFSYENDFSAFQLLNSKESRLITVNDKQIEIKFNGSESILEMIQALKEVNQKIYSATSKEYQLLADREQEQAGR